MDTLSKPFFLKGLKAVCNVFNTHRCATILILKRNLFCPVESVVKVGAALPTETALSKRGCVTSILAVYSNLLKSFATGENITEVVKYIRQFNERHLTEIG